MPSAVGCAVGGKSSGKPEEGKPSTADICNPSFLAG